MAYQCVYGNGECYGCMTCKNSNNLDDYYEDEYCEEDEEDDYLYDSEVNLDYDYEDKDIAIYINTAWVNYRADNYE